MNGIADYLPFRLDGLGDTPDTGGGAAPFLIVAAVIGFFIWDNARISKSDPPKLSGAGHRWKPGHKPKSLRGNRRALGTLPEFNDALNNAMEAVHEGRTAVYRRDLKAARDFSKLAVSYFQDALRIAPDDFRRQTAQSAASEAQHLKDRIASEQSILDANAQMKHFHYLVAKRRYGLLGLEESASRKIRRQR